MLFVHVTPDIWSRGKITGNIHFEHVIPEMWSRIKTKNIHFLHMFFVRSIFTYFHKVLSCILRSFRFRRYLNGVILTLQFFANNVQFSFQEVGIYQNHCKLQVPWIAFKFVSGSILADGAAAKS